MNHQLIGTITVARNLDTALLRSFVAIAETGGVTSAARQLHQTQGAVSQQLKRLEDQLGQPLFDRVGRGLALAPAGERLLGRAQRMLALNDEIWTSMRKPEMTGRVRFGVPHDLVAPLVPPLLKRFARTWPRVQVELVSTITKTLLEELQGGTIDLCLTTELGCGRGGETLKRDRLVWVHARGGTAWQRRPLPYAAGDQSCCFRSSALGALDRADIAYELHADGTSYMQPLLVTVEAELAVATLLASCLPPGLEPVPPVAGLPALPDFAINLYRRPAGLSLAGESLAAHVRDGFVDTGIRAHAA
ncbi:MAG: LysR family transcriptional regulator [Pseudomonadota bacterium]